MRLEADKTLAEVAKVIGDKGVSVAFLSAVESEQKNPLGRRDVKAVLDFLGCPQHLESLMELAMKWRGSVQMEPSSEGERRVLVALDRSMDAGALSDRTIEELLKILNRPGSI